MLAKASLILTLVLSLLFVTQAQPFPLPVEMKAGGECAEMKCERNCCHNPVCCASMEQQRSPQKPTLPPQDNFVQLATIGMRTCTLLFLPPAAPRLFVIRDDARVAHALTPLAANCVRLI
jgi:hypothetical protein